MHFTPEFSSSPLDYFLFLPYHWRSVSTSIWKDPAILLKPQNATGHALSIQSQSNKMHRWEYRTIVQDTTPVLKEQGIPLCNWGPTNSRNYPWRIVLWSEATHPWSSVSTNHCSISGRRCLQMCSIWFMKKNHVCQYRKKAYISTDQRDFKQRERKSHLSSAASKFSWCWTMFQDSFSIPWVSQAA